MRTLRRVGTVAVAAAALSALPMSAWADEDGLAYLELDITVTEDGAVEVTETLGRDFSGSIGSGRTYEPTIAGSGEIEGFGWRDFGLTDVRAEGPGATEVEIEAEETGEDVAVTFHEDGFRGFSGVEEFTLAYTYERFLVPSDHAEPRYYADLVSPDWGISVDETRVTINVPDGLNSEEAHCYAGRVGSSDACDLWEVDENTLRARHEVLDAGEGLTVDLRFAQDSLPVDAPDHGEGGGGDDESTSDDDGVALALIWGSAATVAVIVAAIAVLVPLRTVVGRGRRGGSSGGGSLRIRMGDFSGGGGGSVGGGGGGGSR